MSRYERKEPECRRNYREICPCRKQYAFGKGNRSFVCLDKDVACTSKTKCARMNWYDIEVLGWERKPLDGDDFYDNVLDREE